MELHDEGWDGLNHWGPNGRVDKQDGGMKERWAQEGGEEGR